MCDSCKQNNSYFKSAIIIALIILVLASVMVAHVLFITALF